MDRWVNGWTDRWRRGAEAGGGKGPDLDPALPHWLTSASITTALAKEGEDHHVNLMCMHAKLLHSCPTLCYPMECSPPGSSLHGSLQTRILE